MTSALSQLAKVPPEASEISRKRPGSTYSALSRQVREAGLLGRTRRFYTVLLVVLSAAAVVTGAVFVLLGDSWFQLLVAAALAVVLTQFAFVAHEASHHQVLEPGPGNERLGRILANGVVGISHSWWVAKHNRHHANPNQRGKDPDIDMEALSFFEEAAARKRGVAAWLTRRQGYLFFPLLLLEGVNLHVTSIRSVLAGPGGRERTWEFTTIAVRLAAYVAVLFVFLPAGIAAAFLGVQLAIFGLYMGASFAPNHKGMPIISADSKLDFLRKQVLTSRNIRGGRFMTLALGGLNYQTEHHLFPSMPRPHLARAQPLVREHCRDHRLPYTETGLVESYGIVVAYLNRVGLAARDPFDCPERRRLSAD
jgi:fatty acid desaturase